MYIISPPKEIAKGITEKMPASCFLEMKRYWLNDQIAAAITKEREEHAAMRADYEAADEILGGGCPEGGTLASRAREQVDGYWAQCELRKEAEAERDQLRREEHAEHLQDVLREQRLTLCAESDQRHVCKHCGQERPVDRYEE